MPFGPWVFFVLRLSSPSFVFFLLFLVLVVLVLLEEEETTKVAVAVALEAPQKIGFGLSDKSMSSHQSLVVLLEFLQTGGDLVRNFSAVRFAVFWVRPVGVRFPWTTALLQE